MDFGHDFGGHISLWLQYRDRAKKLRNGVLGDRFEEHGEDVTRRMSPLLLSELELGERVVSLRDGFTVDEEDQDCTCLNRIANLRIEGASGGQYRAVAEHGVAFSLKCQLNACGHFTLAGGVRQKDGAFHRCVLPEKAGMESG